MQASLAKRESELESIDAPSIFLLAGNARATARRADLISRGPQLQAGPEKTLSA